VKKSDVRNFNCQLVGSYKVRKVYLIL